LYFSGTVHYIRGVGATRVGATTGAATAVGSRGRTTVGGIIGAIALGAIMVGTRGAIALGAIIGAIALGATTLGRIGAIGRGGRKGIIDAKPAREGIRGIKPNGVGTKEGVPVVVDGTVGA